MKTTWYRRNGEPMADLRELDTLDRFVALTPVNGYRVSTVFLGLDHSFGSGPPLLFETMVFKGESHDETASFEDVDCERYSTEAEAIAGHEHMVAKWAVA